MNSSDLLGFQETNGLGLTAYSINECEMVLKYPEDTNSSWVTSGFSLEKLCYALVFILTFILNMQFNQQFKMYEPLEYRFDVCESLLLWEQVWY